LLEKLARFGNQRGDLRLRNRALGQELPHHRFWRMRQLEQPDTETRCHFLGRLASKSDRKYLSGLNPGEQQADQPRNEQPCLATAGASSDDDAAAGVERTLIEIEVRADGRRRAVHVQ
jgi:hypothetical protein